MKKEREGLNKLKKKRERGGGDSQTDRQTNRGNEGSLALVACRACVVRSGRSLYVAVSVCIMLMGYCVTNKFTQTDEKSHS